MGLGLVFMLSPMPPNSCACQASTGLISQWLRLASGTWPCYSVYTHTLQTSVSHRSELYFLVVTLKIGFLKKVN